MEMQVTLEDRDVVLEQLYLDPNNPRFADLGARPRVADTKVAEEPHQSEALGTFLNDDRFEIAEMKDSIRQIGFLRMDRMVVVQLPQADCYMVIEGNRRLAALKSLTASHAAGEIDLPEHVITSIEEIPVLVIEGPAKARVEFARTLQGIRHIAGIKPWGAYQQAESIGRMLDEGMSMRAVRSILGLSAQRANLLRRVYFALQQMRSDPEYESSAKPQLFSGFVEALKIGSLREWLGWNEEQAEFENEDRRRQFYGWLVGMDDDEGVRKEPKIVDAKDFREFPKVIEDSDVFNKFLTDPDLKLRAAGDLIAEPPVHVDWRRDIRRCINSLASIPHAEIAEATETDTALLEQLRQVAQQFLADIEVLSKAHAE